MKIREGAAAILISTKDNVNTLRQARKQIESEIPDYEQDSLAADAEVERIISVIIADYLQVVVLEATELARRLQPYKSALLSFVRDHGARPTQPLGNTSKINDDGDDGGTNIPPAEEPKNHPRMRQDGKMENRADVTAPTWKQLEIKGANSVGTPVVTFDFTTWTKYAPQFAALKPFAWSRVLQHRDRHLVISKD